MIKRHEYKYRRGIAIAVTPDKQFDNALAGLNENGDSFRIIHKPYTTELLYTQPITTSFLGKNTQYGGLCKSREEKDDVFGYKNIRCIQEMNANVYQNIIPLIRDGRLNKIQPLKNWPISFVFRDNWQNIKIGSILWYLDMTNFYPSIAVKLGYLSESVMNKFMDDEFKRSRNIALSKLMSIIKVDYFQGGKLSHTIATDRTYVELAYLNIIMYGRNFLNYICDKYRWAVVGRDIDNIIFPGNLKTIIIGKYMNAHGFAYKKYLAHKISSNQLKIAFDGRIKTYRNEIQQT